MMYINPISAAALPGSISQQQLAADKTRQLRQQQRAVRTGSASDEFVAAIEHTEAVDAVHDEQGRRQPDARQQKHREDHDEGEADGESDAPHIDIRA